MIGLYLNPPQHAVVFSLDEKAQVQALDRLDPVLPLSPGRLERHGFEYYRHGILSLYAALNTWSTRKLARDLGVRHMLVQRVWSRASIKPHRTKSYMVSDDPDFESKAAVPAK